MSEEIRRIKLKEKVDGLQEDINYIEYEDGAIAFSDVSLMEGGFVYIYPKSAKKLKSLMIVQAKLEALKHPTEDEIKKFCELKGYNRNDLHGFELLDYLEFKREELQS